MKHVKPGRFPSAMGAIGGILILIIGAIALSTTEMGNDAPPFVIFFLIVWFAAGIGGVIYHLYNATSDKRVTEYDIVPSREERDPSNKFATPETRLRNLDNLRQQGLISETEHQAQRQRILDSL